MADTKPQVWKAQKMFSMINTKGGKKTTTVPKHSMLNYRKSRQRENAASEKQKQLTNRGTEE